MRLFASIAAFGFAFLCATTGRAEFLQRTTPGGVPYLHLALPEAEYGVVAFSWPNTHALAVPGREGLLSLAPQLMLARVDGEPLGDAQERLADARQGAFLLNGLFDTSLTLTSRATGAAAFEPVAGFAADLLTRSDLSEADLERVERTILDNLAATERNPNVMAERALGAFVGGEDRRLAALSHRPTRTVTDVAVEDVARWRATVFDRSALVVAAGPQPREAFEAAIDAVLAGLPETTPASAPPEPAALRRLGETVVVEAPEAPQATVVAAIATPSDHLLDRVLVTALVGGPGSLLFETLRTRLGAAYGVGVRIFSIAPDQAVLAFGAAVPPGRAAEVAAAMRAELADLARTGLPPEALARARDLLAAEVAQGLRDPAARVQAYLARRADGRAGGLAAIADENDALTPEALTAYLAKALGTPATIVAVTPTPDVFGEVCRVVVPEDAARC